MIRVLIALFLMIISIGTLGYMVIENWNIFDALYMTVITLTTTGFQEVHPLSMPGKLFTVLILTGGVGFLTYIITSLIRIFTEGEYKKSIWRNKMQKKVSVMKNHTIICGFGRMGQAVCEEFERRNQPFVVVENDPEVINALHEKAYTCVLGDASNEETLKKANVSSAKNLISVLTTDAQNVYTVLTARDLNRKIYIVTRALDQNAQRKIRNAGANKVICPYAITGSRIAKTILDPAADDFIDFTLGKDFEVELSDILVHNKSTLVGKTILESEIRKKGIIIVGIKQTNGEILFAPSPSRKIEEHERIVALGPREAIKDFNASV